MGRRQSPTTGARSGGWYSASNVMVWSAQIPICTSRSPTRGDPSSHPATAPSPDQAPGFTVRLTFGDVHTPAGHILLWSGGGYEAFLRPTAGLTGCFGGPGAGKLNPQPGHAGRTRPTRCETRVRPGTSADRSGVRMARDPVVQHTDDELAKGLWHLEGGRGLRVNDPLRVELVHLGLVRRSAVGDGVHVTPDGRRFLDEHLPGARPNRLAV
jgi:hypothetical protein